MEEIPGGNMLVRTSESQKILGVHQWFLTRGLRPLWMSKDTFTGVT